AVAVDGEGLAAEGLEHEVGDDAAVVGLETRAVGVEDANDVRVDGVVAVPCGDDGLGEALGLIVDRAWAGGVDASPVGFDLGMYLGVAVALGGGGVQEACVVFAREVEDVDGSGGAGEEGLGAEAGVVDGRGGRGEVEDEVDGTGVEGEGDVVIQECEGGVGGEVGEVGEVAGGEVVDAEEGVGGRLGEESVCEVRAEKACGPGDEDFLHLAAEAARSRSRAGYTAGRPMLMYVNPCCCMVLGSKRLRPSTTMG